MGDWVIVWVFGKVHDQASVETQIIGPQLFMVDALCAK